MRALLADIDRAAPPGRGDPTAAHARDLLGLSYEFSALRVLQRTGDVAAAVAERILGIDVHGGIESRPGMRRDWRSIGRL